MEGPVGFGHRYFVRLRSQNSATPARPFFLLEKYDSAFQTPTQVKQFTRFRLSQKSENTLFCGGPMGSRTPDSAMPWPRNTALL